MIDRPVPKAQCSLMRKRHKVRGERKEYKQDEPHFEKKTTAINRGKIKTERGTFVLNFISSILRDLLNFT